MPTKFLFWNIQNFTYNKINFEANEMVKIYQEGESFLFSGTNTLKNDYILDNVARANPDVFVVIEVVSGQGIKGSLASSVGAQGVLALAERLQKLSTEWCLVPPLKLTDKIQVEQLDEGEDDEAFIQLVREGQYTEAIAVFFRKDKVDFVGPYVWPNFPLNTNPAKTSVAPGDGITPGAYPDEWQKYLPANNYYAGQAEYRNKAGDEVLFPGIGSRRPFLTKFKEKEGKKRLLSVYSVHFPPQEPDARRALVRLISNLQETHHLQDDDVIMIAGDFNVNYLDDRTNLIPFLRTLGFRCYLNAGEEGIPPTPPSMYRRIAVATPDDYRPPLGLDNVAVGYGSEGAFEPVSVLLMNRVRSMTSLGGIPSLLYTPMDTIRSQSTPAEQNELFRQAYNFGRLGPNPGTSDHLAVYIEL